MLNATLHENNGLRVWLPVIVVFAAATEGLARLVATRKPGNAGPLWGDQNMNFVNELHM